MRRFRSFALAAVAAASFVACGVSPKQKTLGIPVPQPRFGELVPPASTTAQADWNPTPKPNLQLPEPPVREWTWARGEPQIYPEGDVGHQLVAGSALCDARHAGVAVRCTDGKSGKVLLSFADTEASQAKHVTSSVEATTLSAVYFEAPELLIYRLDTRTGTLIERQRVKAPTTKNQLISRAILEGSTLWYAQNDRGTGARWDATLRLLDLASGSLRAEVKLPVALSSWTSHADALYVLGTRDGATSVFAFEKGTLRQRFKKSLGDGFVYGITGGPLGVYVQTTTSLFLLDRNQGQELARAPILMRCNQPPKLFGNQLYVCADGLEVYDEKLKRTGRVPLDRWILHFSIHDEWIVAAGRRDLFVIDRTKSQLIAHSTTPEDLWIQSFARLGDGVALVEAVDREGGVARRLVAFGPTPAERLETSALPADARVVERGRPVAELVTRGRHEFDVLRPGYLPVRVTLHVTGTAPNRVELSPNAFVPAPPPPAQPNPRVLPGNMEVLELPQRVPTERKLAFGTFGQFVLGPLRVGLSPEQGLFAVDFTNGQMHSQVPRDAFRSALQGGLGAFERRTHIAKEDLVGVLPQSRLAIVATRGYRPSILAAFDIDTGRRRWAVQTAVKSPASDAPEFYTQAVGEHAGLVWYHTSDVLYGHDLRDGHLVFEHAISDREGMWSQIVFDGDFAYLMYKNELLALQLSSREIAWRAPISGRGFLTLGHDRKRLLFIDKTSVSAYSLAGKLIAKSPKLLNDLDHNPPLLLPDAVFLCGDTKNAFYALDPETLAIRFSMIEPPGDSPCPSYASKRQLALVDGKTAWVLDRQTGKVLLKHARKKRTSADDPEDVFPSALHVAPSGRGACFMIRRGGVCYE